MTLVDQANDAANWRGAQCLEACCLPVGRIAGHCLSVCAALLLCMAATVAVPSRPLRSRSCSLKRRRKPRQRAGGRALQVGFNDVYRVGCWTPVEVVLHGGAEALHGRVELSLLDGDGMASEIVSDELTLPAGKQTRVLAVRQVRPARRQRDGGLQP